MGERNNGRRRYQRPTHGTEMRGVFSPPSASMVGYQYDQSRLDREAVLQKFRLRQLERFEQSTGIGNRELPSHKHKNEILNAIENARAIILGGETGSGKSTQLPQYLYEAGYDKTYVLVPRRVIADNLVDRIREELKPHLGEKTTSTVGVVHGERVEIHDENRIIIMTSDTFNGMITDIEAQHGDKKVAIIADEIHEANIFTEIATGVAATAVRDHDSWRLIAASATHNASTLIPKFARINGTQESEVPIVTIEGRPFTTEIREAPSQTPPEVYASLEVKPDKTMIFTSGKREIEYIIDKTREELEARELGSSQFVVFRKLHSQLTETELAHINDPVPEGYKLAIVSSPAGMSGITIPGVTCVITDGTINRPELDKDGIPGLRRYHLSRAGIIQQIGRAGRDVAGGVGIIAKPAVVDEYKLRAHHNDDSESAELETTYKMIDMAFQPFDSADRLDHEPAEIYHTNLASVVLRQAVAGRRFATINEYIPHDVTPSAIIAAEQALARLGALDDEDRATKVGRLMDRFPVNPELSRGLAEAHINSRPIQHMARMALIAAAIEQGGLQDFTQKRTARWQRLIRPTTEDDFIAQLDISVAMINVAQEHDWSYEQYAIYDNDLHPKKIELAKKTARKILRILNVKLENVVLMPPNYQEEALLRRDFTAGMIDNVYEYVGSRQKKRYYRNIHGDNTSTERFLSRSVAKPEEGELIAGFPRWFEKRLPRNVVQHNDVVEQVLKVTKEDIIHFAQQHGVVSTRPLPPRLVGDKVLEQQQQVFGSIDIGRPVPAHREQIPAATQKIIVEYALEHQGAAQRALRTLADELEYYRNIIPPDEIDMYRRTNAPEEIDAESIEALLREYAKETRSLSHIDRKIAYYMYSKGVGITRYYDNEARIAMQERSPKRLQIGARVYDVFYSKGQPYITNISREDEDVAKQGIFLPDGREILLRIARKGSATVRLISLRTQN